MTVKCIIFDCDGTLVDSEHLTNEVIAEMSADGTTAEITKRWFGRDISM